jgi:polyhydroxyalkanoate synthesis regulator phasin
VLILVALALGAASDEGQSASYHRLEERLAEFDRAARAIGRLERDVEDLEERVEKLEAKWKQ